MQETNEILVEQETTTQEEVTTIETETLETQEEQETTTDLIEYDTSVLVDINTNLNNISYTLNCSFILVLGVLASIIVYKFVHRFF